MVLAVLVLLTTACIRLDRKPAIALGVVIAAWLYTLGLVNNDTQYGDARAVIGIAWAAGAVGIADAVRSWRRYTASAEAELERRYSPPRRRRAGRCPRSA
jgi:ammonia channel protein AmtB